MANKEESKALKPSKSDPNKLDKLALFMHVARAMSFHQWSHIKLTLA